MRMGEITTTVVAEPLSHALRLVKNMLLRAHEASGAATSRVFLSGPTNYRTALATIRPYKGNRPSNKPVHYEKIREYLISTHHAEVSDNVEADDMLGINQRSGACIATIDKDLDNIPGYHYNLRSGRFYDVLPAVATRNFYTQLLTGDATDNIVGVPGIGKVKAAMALKGLVTEEDYYWRILEEYAKVYSKPYEALEENARLLWILRKPLEEGGAWLPPE